LHPEKLAMFRSARIAACVIAASVLGAAPGPAADDIETALPCGFAGEFRWIGDSTPQRVEIRINVIKRTGPARVEALGCGRYEVLDRVTDIGVQFLIDPDSFAIEIREFSPSGTGAPNFVTDGSHKGRLSRDLKTIETEWVTAFDGQRGRMRLEAGPEIKCAGDAAQGGPPAERKQA
jgi:hypothetical protein